MSDISKNLKNIRKEKGITQQEIADKLSVTRQAVSNWETGKTQPDIETLEKLAGVYQTELEDLIYGRKVRQRDKRQLIKRTLILGIITAAYTVFALCYGQWAHEMLSHSYIFSWTFWAMAVVRPIQYILTGITLMNLLNIFFPIHMKQRKGRIISAAIVAALMIIFPVLANVYWLTKFDSGLWYYFAECFMNHPEVYLVVGIVLHFAAAKK